MSLVALNWVYSSRKCDNSALAITLHRRLSQTPRNLWTHFFWFLYRFIAFASGLRWLFNSAQGKFAYQWTQNSRMKMESLRINCWRRGWTWIWNWRGSTPLRMRTEAVVTRRLAIPPFSSLFALVGLVSNIVGCFTTWAAAKFDLGTFLRYSVLLLTVLSELCFDLAWFRWKSA